MLKHAGSSQVSSKGVRLPILTTHPLRSLDREWMFAFGLAFAQLAFCGYRAAHQSVNLDEAYTFTSYLEHSWREIYGPYDANNHVLFSILARLSIKLFGLSELSLRAP